MFSTTNHSPSVGRRRVSLSHLKLNEVFKRTIQELGCNLSGLKWQGRKTEAEERVVSENIEQNSLS